MASVVKVTRLRLRRFKRFADWQAGFAPGLTVVRGPNEAGKTTVMEALFEGLFGAPARGEAASRLRTWGEQRLGEITVEMQVNGSRYLLRRDLEAGTILLQSDDGRERVETHRDVQRRLLEWIGLGSEGAYRATAFVGQADLARVSEDRRLVSAHLSKILSGSGVEGVQQALQWLSERRARLAGDAQAARTAADRVAELRAQQASLRQREERAHRHRLERQALVDRLDEIERVVAEKGEAARLARRAAELHQRERDLAVEEAALREQLARVTDLQQRLATQDAALREFSTQQEALIADLFHARRQHLQLESTHASAREQAGREESTLEHLATVHQTAARSGGAAWALCVFGAIFIVGGALAAMSSWVPQAGWILLAGGVLLAIVGLRLRGRISAAGAGYRAQEQRVLELRSRVEVLQRQLAEAEGVVATRLRAVGSPSLEDVERRYSAYIELLREREETRAALRQTGATDSTTTCEARVAAITAELADVRRTLQTLPKGARRGAGTNGEQLELQTRALSAEANELRERRARLEGVLEELRDRGDDSARIDEEIAAIQAAAARERQALEVIELSAKMLEEARTLSVYPARELLERRAGEILNLATAGAYAKVALDERTLRPQVWVSSPGAWKEAPDLSQATSDQLYLALRLALLDVISGDRRPPLFLDEPFAHLDESRRRAMTSVLRAASRDRQVVLFTCWPDFDAIADRVITLEHVPQGVAS
jgi:uncharacterized protein YhaN